MMSINPSTCRAASLTVRHRAGQIKVADRRWCHRQEDATFSHVFVGQWDSGTDDWGLFYSLFKSLLL